MHRERVMTALLDALTEPALAAARPQRYGQVTQMVGMSIEVAGIPAAIGDGLLLLPGDERIEAEVVALRDGRVVCLALGETAGLRAGTRVCAMGGPLPVRVGPELLGRVLDGIGRPMDEGPAISGSDVSVTGAPPHPLRRGMVAAQLPLGVRVLDGLIPCGKGQRLGIFAGSGVGKSSLMSMIARGTAADVSVVALIGERGREVAEFIARDLGPEGLARSVVVVATSDAPAVMRIRAAFTATRIAEWFRDQGNDVVLMMDSVTRFAMAQREVGLAAGEPPATRGYPPSVFGLLPRLLERAGLGERGSITGLYTVLVEGDDMNEPIADTARSILDGHIQLSRALAESNHYPAVDVLGSISRVAPVIAPPEQLRAGAVVRELLAAWRDVKDLIEIGAYVAGTNPVVDRAVVLKPAIDAFCRQAVTEVTTLAGARDALVGLVPAEAEERLP
jgi:flagellum-specific ATP synthase